ncbi:MAG: sodium/proton-translocating pyrophosphatase [Candidatus Berkelbacteria bacterium]
MYNIALFSTLGLSVLAVIYSLLKSMSIRKNPSGSKKMFDVSKSLVAEMKLKHAQNLKDFALVAIVLFTGIIYAFGWQSATCFLVGAVLFSLIDYYLMGISTSTTLRLAEAARSGVMDAYKINNNFSSSAAVLVAGSGLFLVSLTHFFFKDLATLLALALSAILVSIFSWRGGKLNFIGSYVAALSAAVILTGASKVSYQNIELLPLLFAGLGIVAMIVGQLFARLNSKTLNISAVLYRLVAVFSVLFLAAAYFGPRYIFAISNIHDLLKLAIALVVGLVAGLVAIFVRQISKIMPTIIIAVAILVANYLAGVYGLALTVIGLSFIWPLIFANNLFVYLTKNAAIIADGAEMAPAAAENIELLASGNLKTTGYFISLCGLVAVAILAFYFGRFTNFGFAFIGPKLLPGLLLGGAMTYIISSELVNNKILKLAIVVLAAIVAGLALEPVFLAGLLAGAILVDILVSQAVSAEVLAVTIVGVLLVDFIQSPYTLMVRAAIVAVAVVVPAASWIIKKIYDGRKAKIAN